MAFEGAQIRSKLDGASPVLGWRQDAAIGQLVTLDVFPPVQALNYRWRLIGRPEGSIAGGPGPEPIELGTSPSASFTVDGDSPYRHDGTYDVECVLNLGATNETRLLAGIARLSGLTLTDGRPLRKLGGLEDFALDTADPLVAQGWAKQLNRWLEALRATIAGGGGGGAPPLLTYRPAEICNRYNQAIRWTTANVTLGTMWLVAVPVKVTGVRVAIWSGANGHSVRADLWRTDDATVFTAAAFSQTGVSLANKTTTGVAGLQDIMFDTPVTVNAADEIRVSVLDLDDQRGLGYISYTPTFNGLTNRQEIYAGHTDHGVFLPAGALVYRNGCGDLASGAPAGQFPCQFTGGNNPLVAIQPILANP